jgi:hypothetical protein
MGGVFEDICVQWLWRENFTGRLPFDFQDCGRWWGANPLRKEEQEIDILAYDEKNKKGMFCECKWTNEEIGSRVLDDLIDKAKMFDYREKYYMLFSKSGFKSELKKRADKNILLIAECLLFRKKDHRELLQIEQKRDTLFPPNHK